MAVEDEHDVLVLTVADGTGATEAVLFEEADGGGVPGEGVGVEGPVGLAQQEQPEGYAPDPSPQYGRASQYPMKRCPPTPCSPSHQATML